jgi:hypothetical protein
MERRKWIYDQTVTVVMLCATRGNQGVGFKWRSWKTADQHLPS